MIHYEIFLGAMRDAFSHFSRPFLWPYVILGGFSVISGIILFGVAPLQRLQSKGKQVEIPCDTFDSEKVQSTEEKQEKV